MKSNRHKKTPTLAGDGVLGNESNYQERNVMSNNNTATSNSNVIPFDFRGHNVRTVLLSGEPWFVAVDACKVLGLANATTALLALDEDERSKYAVGKFGVVNIVNESGLYTLILRCRDAVTKGSKAHAFRRWVTTEVLPSIRKDGGYVDTSAKMASLVEGLIGVTELTVIKGLVRQKGHHLPAENQRSAGARLYSAVRTRFNVARTELIPHKDFAEACNFIAAYSVLDGEYIQASKKDGGIYLDQHEAHHLYLMMDRFWKMFQYKDNMLAAARALGSSGLMDMFDYLYNGHGSYATLNKRKDELEATYNGMFVGSRKSA